MSIFHLKNVIPVGVVYATDQCGRHLGAATETRAVIRTWAFYRKTVSECVRIYPWAIMGLGRREHKNILKRKKRNLSKKCNLKPKVQLEAKSAPFGFKLHFFLLDEVDFELLVGLPQSELDELDLQLLVAQREETVQRVGLH